MKILSSLILAALATTPMLAEDTDAATAATNQLGLEILARAAKPAQNFLLSPYSIQSALAMTFAGADGATREEMAKVLHFPPDDAALQSSFSALNKALTTAATRSAERAKDAGPGRAKRDPLQLHVANRLFGQKGYSFRQPFLAALATGYGAPLEEMDFAASPEKARTHINGWVGKQTQEKITDLIPPNGLSDKTHLVLTNALYFKAPWTDKFELSATEPRPFQTADGKGEKVPTMRHQTHYAYAAHDGFVAVAVPYDSGDLQFLILLPDAADGLAAMKRKITPDLLAGCAKMKTEDVILYLPKLKLQPPTMALADTLKSLGLRSAFDDPRGSANFDRMAPRKPDDYLYIGAVFHKTFLALDEEGTEAAAATAVVMMRATAVLREPKKPIEVKVDRPFLFAIQHRQSGACLFLGQIADPR